MNYIKNIRQYIGSAEIFVNCAAVWIENSHGVLLERRGDDGNWGLLGGIMELGESPSDTAKREIKEETGLNANIKELIGVYSRHRHTYPNGDKAQPIVFFFRGDITEEAELTPSSESIELRYFSRIKLPELGMPQHRQMMKDALADKKNVLS